MTKTAHPFLSSDILKSIEEQIIYEEDLLQKQLEILSQKRLFLSATQIYQLFEEKLETGNYFIKLAYSFNEENEAYLVKIKILDSNNIKVSSTLAKDIFPFLINFTQEIGTIGMMDALINDSTVEHKIVLTNDVEGRFSFLNILLKDNYDIWQTNYLQEKLDSTLSDKPIQKKQNKI